MSDKNLFEETFKYSLFAPLIVDERYMYVPEHLALKAKGIRMMNSLSVFKRRWLPNSRH